MKVNTAMKVTFKQSILLKKQSDEIVAANEEGLLQLILRRGRSHDPGNPAGPLSGIKFSSVHIFCFHPG